MPKSRRPRAHKEYSFNLPCEGKNRYETEEDAQNGADFHMLEDMTLNLAVYQCPYCQYWHMTSYDDTGWRKEMPKQ